MSQSDCLVTVVIATYNRPDTLSAAVRSVMQQTVERWRLLVVGDGCDERTGEALGRFHDERLSYLNLSERFGEQGGPNSVGMALAETPFVALLNHDDLFLPDHLEKALSALRRTGGGMYVGRAALAERLAEDGAGARPVFAQVSPLRRRPWHAYSRQYILFEPASTWVMRSDLCRKVGAWRPSWKLQRVPLQDWVLRVWRAGARFVFGGMVTVVYLLTHNLVSSAAGSYSVASRAHEWAESLLATRTSDEVRSILAKDLEPSAEHWGLRLHKPRMRLLKRLRTPATSRLAAWVYRLTGFDLYTALMNAGGGRAGIMGELARRRTGREAPMPEDFEGIVARAVAAAARTRGANRG